ncbi:MAG TPA: GNAT family N-acetyltransferase [Ktedonobacterales bacterium]|nr:GNAT family N-acetyltransferase [Ktedonobacterales bacterium]
MTDEWHQGEYRITTDPARMNLDVIHGYLTASYWAAGIPRETVARSIAHSLPFGLFAGDRQIGFARVITDYATFAYIGDVFVLADYRRRGLAHWLLRVVVEHPALQGLRRWSLATRDAHALYQSVGFTPLSAPERWMERRDADVYQRSAE